MRCSIFSRGTSRHCHEFRVLLHIFYTITYLHHTTVVKRSLYLCKRAPRCVHTRHKAQSFYILHALNRRTINMHQTVLTPALHISPPHSLSGAYISPHSRLPPTLLPPQKFPPQATNLFIPVAKLHKHTRPIPSSISQATPITMGSTRYNTQRADSRRPREDVVQQGTTQAHTEDPYRARGPPLRAGEARACAKHDDKPASGRKK